MPYAIIIDCSMISYIDVSGIVGLRTLVQKYRQMSVRVLLTGVATHVAEIMAHDSQFREVVPGDQIYISVHDAVHTLVEILNATREMKQDHSRLDPEDGNFESSSLDLNRNPMMTGDKTEVLLEIETTTTSSSND